MCLLIWNSTGSLSVKFPQRRPTPCKSGRPSCGPALHRLVAKMSDKGLSDEAVTAACKDGDPITKVRQLFLLKLNRQTNLSNPAEPNRPTALWQVNSYAPIYRDTFLLKACYSSPVDK